MLYDDGKLHPLINTPLIENMNDNKAGIEYAKIAYTLKDIKCNGIQELASSSIRFRITVTCKFLEQFDLGRFLKKEIINTFKKNNITIPYNQVVVHNG